MAKVTITIEDTPDGGVRIVADPTIQQLSEWKVEGRNQSAAHDYAFCMTQVALKLSEQFSDGYKEKSDESLILTDTSLIDPTIIR
jgi:hypothetical protein